MSGNIYSTSIIKGGLGNQMFQIAHAISQSLRYNVKSMFDFETYYRDNIFSKINFGKKIGDFKKVHEKDFCFVYEEHEWNSSIEFDGYYQSSKNFYGYDNEIKELFSPSVDFLNKIYRLYPGLKNNKSVSLHIRRGDYLSNPSYHPVINKSYIDSSLNLIIDYDYIYVFSDDKEWARKNLSYEKMIIVESLEDYEDLWMMSLCKFNIISNSTFSWWGAFLNRNLDKKIISPSIWFGPIGPKKYHDIYEEGWCII